MPHADYLRVRVSDKNPESKTYLFQAHRTRLETAGRVKASMAPVPEHPSPEFLRATNASLKHPLNKDSLSDQSILVFLFPGPAPSGWEYQLNHPLTRWFEPRVQKRPDPRLQKLLSKVASQMRGPESKKTNKRTFYTQLAELYCSGAEPPSAEMAAALEKLRRVMQRAEPKDRAFLQRTFQCLPDSKRQEEFGEKFGFGLVQGSAYDQNLLENLLERKIDPQAMPRSHEKLTRTIAGALTTTPKNFHRRVAAGDHTAAHLTHISRDELASILEQIPEKHRLAFHKNWGKHRENLQGKPPQVGHRLLFAKDKDKTWVYSRPMLLNLMEGRDSHANSEAANFTRALAAFLKGQPVPKEFRAVLHSKLDPAKPRDAMVLQKLNGDLKHLAGKLKHTTKGINP